MSDDIRIGDPSARLMWEMEQREYVIPKKKKFDKYFMGIAELTAGLSTCVSKHVGAVLVYDNRIIATGYNGTSKGRPHCYELFSEEKVKSDSKERMRHHDFSLREEIHAELNAILDAGKRGTLIEGSTLYVTLQPCIECAKLVIAAGVKRVVFTDVYDLGDDRGEEFLRASGVEVQRGELEVDDESDFF